MPTCTAIKCKFPTPPSAPIDPRLLDPNNILFDPSLLDPARENPDPGLSSLPGANASDEVARAQQDAMLDTGVLAGDPYLNPDPYWFDPYDTSKVPPLGYMLDRLSEELPLPEGLKQEFIDNKDKIVAVVAGLVPPPSGGGGAAEVSIDGIDINLILDAYL